MENVTINEIYKELEELKGKLGEIPKMNSDISHLSYELVSIKSECASLHDVLGRIESKINVLIVNKKDNTNEKNETKPVDAMNVSARMSLHREFSNKYELLEKRIMNLEKVVY